MLSRVKTNFFVSTCSTYVKNRVICGSRVSKSNLATCQVFDVHHINHISRTKIHQVAVNASVCGQVNDNLTEYGFWDMACFNCDRLHPNHISKTKLHVAVNLSVCGRVTDNLTEYVSLRHGAFWPWQTGLGCEFAGRGTTPAIDRTPAGRHSPCRSQRSWWISGSAASIKLINTPL